MNKKLVKVLSLAMVAFMLFAMSAAFAVSAEESAVIENSLGKYPYPHPTAGEKKYYWGWNQRDNTFNSEWYNDSETSGYNVEAATEGYTDANGVKHPYGVGMHSAITNAPSTVWNINAFKVTSFKTTVYLVQYDMADDVANEDVRVDVTPTEEELVPIVVYLDLGKMEDGKLVWTAEPEDADADGVTDTDENGYQKINYFQEKSLLKKDAAGENNAVVLEVDAADLQGYTHIKIGIKTQHGLYTFGTDSEGNATKELTGNTAMASVYFADLEITQSEKVAVIVPPAVPNRANTTPAQSNVYDVILPPESDEANWFGKPYGAWKAGSNTKTFLSDLEIYGDSSNTPNKDYVFGQPTYVNSPYAEKEGTVMLFGAEGMEHAIEKGFSMHPKHANEPVQGRTDSWTIYDISEYTAAGADTFYALVGLTSTTNQHGSKLNSPGVTAYIYGDKIGDGQHYELLAQSELVKGYNIGEFNVNVEGVKLLLIDVIIPKTAVLAPYSGVSFGNACLFTADANAVKPDYSGDYVPEVEDNGTDNGAADNNAANNNAADNNTADEGKKKGCGGVVTGAAGILFATVVAGAACFGKRRREE